jgi:hypothetical protein
MTFRLINNGQHGPDDPDDLLPIEDACPKCGERRFDCLEWRESCAKCGVVFDVDCETSADLETCPQCGHEQIPDIDVVRCSTCGDSFRPSQTGLAPKRAREGDEVMVYIIWCEGRLEELRREGLLEGQSALTAEGWAEYRKLVESGFVPRKKKLMWTLESMQSVPPDLVKELCSLMVRQS